jgi:hypothetical protein
MTQPETMAAFSERRRRTAVISSATVAAPKAIDAHAGTTADVFPEYPPQERDD